MAAGTAEAVHSAAAALAVAPVVSAAEWVVASAAAAPAADGKEKTVLNIPSKLWRQKK